MKLIDERTQARAVAALWRERYLKAGKWDVIRHGACDTGEVYERLIALDAETATAAAIEAIIGNNSWCAHQMCDECRAYKPQVVQLGEEPDYESATANVCVDCLRKALALAGGAP